jgi:transcription elongation GreA/GreB family factor
MTDKREVRDAVAAAQRAAIAAAERAIAQLHGASELDDETINDPSLIAQSSVDLGTAEALDDTLRPLRDSLAQLKAVDLTPSTTVGPGSLVQVDDEYYFVAISADDVEVNGLTVQSVSPEAPFTQAMLGKSAGDEFTVRGHNYRIDQVG